MYLIKINSLWADEIPAEINHRIPAAYHRDTYADARRLARDLMDRVQPPLGVSIRRAPYRIDWFGEPHLTHGVKFRCPTGGRRGYRTAAAAEAALARYWTRCAQTKRGSEGRIGSAQACCPTRVYRGDED